jgi:hypothetical protein
MIEQPFVYEPSSRQCTRFSPDMLPTSQPRLILHCEGYSCLAQLDQKGTWRNPFTNEPINAVIRDWEPI